ncbi:MAG: hypothetical protein QM534_12815 [Sediminibacterium sp.]|nr:hypothetical protein [Sediminibacterium sp.]
MKRKAVYLEADQNGKIAIYIDQKNMNNIVAYIQQDARHLKKWMYIKNVILSNLRIPEVFDKEDIDKECKDVYAMKFFKGQENDRIYCKRLQHKGKNCVIIVASELHLKKKTQKNSAREIALIKSVASYEYSIE